MSRDEAHKSVERLVHTGCLPHDPLPWILASEEPFAVWHALTQVLGTPAEPEVIAARSASLASSAVHGLVKTIAAAGTKKLSRHDDPRYLPGLLRLASDMGVRAGDFDEVDDVLERMLEGQLRDGRIQSSLASRPKPSSGSRLCDTIPVVEALMRLGMSEDRRVQRAINTIKHSIRHIDGQDGWCCVPEKRSLFSASNPVCPQLETEGIRLLAALPQDRRPRSTGAVVRTPLLAWRDRAEQRPYGFGHGYQFKTVRWPSLWYDSLSVVDAVGRLPFERTSEERLALAEMAACLIAYNLDADGRVAPVRVHEGFDFLHVGVESAFATSCVLAALVRIADEAELIAGIDVSALASSRGPQATAVQPSDTSKASTCVTPIPVVYDAKRILPRILTRQHLASVWEPQSLESVVADTVALWGGHPYSPPLSLAARLPEFHADMLTDARFERRSIASIRCMRGQNYLVRQDMLSVVHAATQRQVLKYAREFARAKGLKMADYERIAPEVEAQCAEKAPTLSEIRQATPAHVDLGAVITMMTAERRLLSWEPSDGPFGRRTTYRLFSAVFPQVDLDEYSEDEARAALLRAYVRGYGPVTRKDAAWWTGMDLKRVQRAFEALEDEIVEVGFRKVEGSWLMHAADADELERASILGSPVVSLLPANDPLIVSYMDRSRFVDDAARPYVFDKVGNSAPVVVVDGRVCAVWDFEQTSGFERIAIFPVAALDAEAGGKLAESVASIGKVRFGREVTATPVLGMLPLTTRQVGAYLHPLR